MLHFYHYYLLYYCLQQYVRSVLIHNEHKLLSSRFNLLCRQSSCGSCSLVLACIALLRAHYASSAVILDFTLCLSISVKHPHIMALTSTLHTASSISMSVKCTISSWHLRASSTHTHTQNLVHLTPHNHTNTELKNCQQQTREGQQQVQPLNTASHS
jgi:hypothetical protein